MLVIYESFLHHQLKNELHQLHMGDKCMFDIVMDVGIIIDPEDIILYTLNGKPSSYHAYKISIQIKLQPICFDNLYSLLCVEELNIIVEASWDRPSEGVINSKFALAVALLKTYCYALYQAIGRG
ncbi:hypothetical protein IEQ34_009876 [Dendrobium chrysotoxum]|uniref:Uncharacterized protein n=1 Tax=Dendrobium chrysotoxum TaxID=161865 RepID=A0AAV7GZQ7_DENCH|nr:hypothetical protein IEQ34_009876 [Dendrobium chrysotoxum]